MGVYGVEYWFPYGTIRPGTDNMTRTGAHRKVGAQALGAGVCTPNLAHARLVWLLHAS